MGLDMFLFAERYIFWNETETQEKVRNVFPEMNDYKPKKVKFEVIYWRKANEIHKWFVDNVQKGKDDCGEYWVEWEDLEKLLETCKLVRDNPERAKELLPTQEGFFFGETDYDEYYWEENKETISKLEKLLSKENELEWYGLYYQSSW